MKEIVFYTADFESFCAEMQNLALLLDDGETIVTDGPLSDGGWVLNIVGDVYDQGKKLPGYWARFRINGIPEKFPSFTSNAVVYAWSDKLNDWTSDGKTAAPAWVASIGVMA